MAGQAGATPGRGPGADAIVVAAGNSSRMGGVDKRLALLAGRPLLIRTLEAVAASPVVERIVLVMGSGGALDALRPLLPPAVVAIVPGGDHRGASVAAGFVALLELDGESTDPDRLVLVHDGARPLVTPELVTAVAAAAARHGAAIPVLPVTDTVRRVRDGVLGGTLERSDLVTAQTPQGVTRRWLAQAFERYPASGAERFTDEAALLLACTIRVHHIPGDPLNLKVTTPGDLARAHAVLATGLDRRVGQGMDSHPFGPGEPLVLGGVEIAGAPRLYGHSDGDVALHAIADGILGATALDDLGRMFPSDARTPIGVSSAGLLADVVARAAAAGWAVETVDITITGARPRLTAHLDPMRTAIADVLRVPMTAVGMKASTGNLEGATGAGRAISAFAIVTIVARPPERYGSGAAGARPS